ncbi:M81 family metallopeptidase [Phreatobacter sp.]|uniref:M81 family metallopeptidase n=1 Tax=Phreatobacter sp. TaxID=1966341 RepID=UPI0022C10CB5|nr:M81 family metallopeptidase [Phreatobacter sp.]MCZ8314645.1 M81 family metallopeptidase [Phreatobacter sp.]
MRIFTASIATETNTFSPIPTSLDSYLTCIAFRPGEHPTDKPTLCTAPLFVARQRAQQEGFMLVEGSCFFAQPAGPTTRIAYETMREEILAQLKAALPVDGVLLGMHGAMVADGYDDCEGDMLERVRALVGPTCVIGVELDPHCHMTAKRVGLADIIVCFKEYPHVDILPRAEELLTLVLKTIRGEIRPVASLYDCGMIAFYPTTSEPNLSFVARQKSFEGRDGILSVSFVHGFPHADVPDMGSRMLVYSDGDKAKGAVLASQLGEEIIALRGRTAPPNLDFVDALDLALAADTAKGPAIIAEPADNAGGGSASDNTLALRELIARGLDNVAVAPLWDPQAVAFCLAVGPGARLRLRIGGKTSDLSGDPVDADCEVLAVARDQHQSFGEAKAPVGDLAAVRIGGVTVIMNTNRCQALGRELFTALGLDPSSYRLLVLKSAQHFMAGYGPIASHVFYSETQGPSTQRYETHAYSRIARPKWPLDAEASGTLLL